MHYYCFVFTTINTDIAFVKTYMKMLKQTIIVTVAFTLSLVAHGVAQFDMSSWLSSSEEDDSLESTSSSEEFETFQEISYRKSRNAYVPTTVRPLKPPTSINCNLEQLTIPNYRSQDRTRSETQYCLKCRNVLVLLGQNLEVQGKPYLKYIMFENSTVSFVAEGLFSAFTNFTQLYQLYLNDSFVNTIKAGAFNGLNALEELYLQNNNISSLYKWVFNYLPHLKLLNLANNKVDYIQVNVFTDLLSLRNLYLNNNNIKIILEGTFSNLKHLRYVDLSNNRILDTSTLLFYTLGTLNLRNNNLTAVDFSIFPIYLEQLFLDNNQINLIENLKNIENTANLTLSKNNISTMCSLPGDVMHANFSRNKVRDLTNSVFIGAVELVTLDFSYNLLENLNKDAFVKTGKLAEIYLQNNQLADVPIGCFRYLQNLKLLNLSSNYITDFQFEIFAGLGNLEHLDISNNKAAYVYENSFHALTNLKVLNIAGNFLISFDAYDLIDYSKWLTNVTLDNNRWLCKYLAKIVTALENAHVNVTKGAEVQGENINGIACSNQKYIATTMVPYFRNLSAEAALSKLHSISEELRRMRNFFDQDFINSTFYKYLESVKDLKSTENFNSKSISNVLLNQIDEDFKNTTFYKYISNPKSLESLSNISNTLHYLHANVENAFSNLSSSSMQYGNHVGYPRYQDILLKVSELQNIIKILVIIFIVMLLSIVFSVLIRKASNPLMHIINKSSFRKVSRKSSSSAEIELI